MAVDHPSEESNTHRTLSRIWRSLLWRCISSKAIFCSVVSSTFTQVSMIFIIRKMNRGVVKFQPHHSGIKRFQFPIREPPENSVTILDASPVGTKQPLPPDHDASLHNFHKRAIMRTIKLKTLEIGTQSCSIKRDKIAFVHIWLRRVA